MKEMICSGLLGAVLGQGLMIVWGAWRHRREFRALLVSILAECDYNLSILDEVTHGATDGRKSFKRLAIEYFKAVHKDVIRYTHDYNLLRTISRVTVDMELFNREVDLNGEIKSSRLDQVIRGANQGVRNSLNALKDHVSEKYQMEECSYE